MKLTDKQIYAIINQAKDNFDKKNKLAKDKLYKDPILIKKSKDIHKEYIKLSPEIKDLYYGYRNDISEKSFLDKLVNKKHKTDIFNSNELYNKIVILSIDSKDLEDLKKKLKLEF